MNRRLVETIALENSLALQIWDLSRPLAGDRWLVSLEARVDIPLDISYLDSLPNKDKVFSVLRDKFGQEVSYRYVQEKHFVDAREKTRVFQGFVDNVKSSLIPYLNHPEFGKRTVLARYVELKKKSPHLFSN